MDIQARSSTPSTEEDGATRNSWLDGASARAIFLMIVVPSFVLFFATATKSGPFHIDPFTNTVASWSLGTEQSVYVDDYAEYTTLEFRAVIGWFVETDEGTVVVYPPGTALWGAPFYALGPSGRDLLVGIPQNDPSLGPQELLVPHQGTAAVAASLAVALAIGWLGLTVRSVASNRHALAAAYLAGFGTTAWAVASDQLWQHGPAMMWIALATYLASRAHLWGAGVAHGMAVLTRPVTAVIAASAGIVQSWRDRSLRPVIQIGLGSFAGLAAVLAYNNVVFGSLSLRGGYSDTFVAYAADANFGWFLGNTLRGLVDPAHGLLPWAPFLLVLVPGLRAGWRAAPAWARGPAIGGVVYLLAHWKSNYFSGGAGFFGYRYPLEALMAMAPLLYFAYREWVAQRPVARKVFTLTAVGAVALQAVVAIR